MNSLSKCENRQCVFFMRHHKIISEPVEQWHSGSRKKYCEAEECGGGAKVKELNYKRNMGSTWLFSSGYLVQAIKHR